MANVSHTTVSLALASKKSEPSRVSREIRKKVLQIAEQLNYRPNFAARSLATQKTKTIGLVLTTLLNHFYAEFAQDIIDRAAIFGYGVFTASVRKGIDEEKKAVESLIDRGVDGLIISSVVRKDPVIDQLIEMDIPFVLAMRNVDRSASHPLMHYVGIDNQRGGFLAVEHLLKMGHKRIGLIAGPEETSTGHDRRLGALEALNQFGANTDKNLLVTGDHSRISGYDATLRLLELNPPPTAIFAMNDMMAIGVLEALKEREIRVPEDVAVVGFDDIMLTSLTIIGLTTISQKKETMGAMAVDSLLEILKRDPSHVIKQSILDPVLVIRKTCGFNKE